MPYSFASPRTIRNGRRDASEAAAASATAPSSGPARRAALGLQLGHRGGEPRAERLEQVGNGLEAVLVEVVRGALAGAKHEVALEVGMLAQGADELRVVH